MKTQLLFIAALTSYCISVKGQWSVVGSGSYPGTTGNVYELKTFNNKLYCAGVISDFDMLATSHVATEDIGTWNGTAWGGIVPGITSGTGVYALQEYLGELYVGGNIFPKSGGCTDTMIAKINASNTWSSVGGGVSNDVNAFAVYNNELYVGGAFIRADNIYAAWAIAKWNGTSWSRVGPSYTDPISGITASGLYAFVNALYADTVNNLLYAGGSFNLKMESGGWDSVSCIVAYNGTNWSELGTNIKFGGYGSTDPYINSIIMYNGELYAGGKFQKAGGVTVNSIAKWNGTSWSALGTGLTGVFGGDPEVKDMIVFNNKLVIVGSFADTVVGITQWDGSNFSSVGSGLTNPSSTTSTAVEVFQNCLYVGGGIYKIGTPTAYGIAKFCGVTGVESIESNNAIKIYPNPFSSTTTLQTDKILKNAILTVYNSFGQQVKQIKNISGQTVTLSRDKLASGLYFVRLTENNKTITTDKLVITD